MSFCAHSQSSAMSRMARLLPRQFGLRFAATTTTRRLLNSRAAVDAGTKPSAASSSIATQVEEQGYAVAKKALSPALLADINRHFDWLRITYPDIPGEHLHHPLVRRDAFWMHIATHHDLINLVTPVLGQDLALFASHYVCKDPQVGLAVLPHQDVWPLKPMEVVSVFAAIDECSSRNGGLQVLPGSHKPGLQAHHPTAAGDNVFGASLSARFKDAVELDLESGDVVIMHANVVHASKPNESDLRRCGLTLRYIPTSTQVTNQSRSTSYLWMAAGEKDPAINKYHSWPLYIPGYHPEFPGCEQWNAATRRVENEDEHNFTALPAESQIAPGEQRAREDVANIMETLSKGKRRAMGGYGCSVERCEIW